jgi:hypothetical protein
MFWGHLVDIVLVHALVHHVVQRVQELHHLQRRAGLGHQGKVDHGTTKNKFKLFYFEKYFKAFIFLIYTL